MANIPPDVTSIPEGDSVPGAIGTRTDIETPGWVGPCPPKGHGPHRYVFAVSCLGVESIPVEADTSGAVVGFFTNMNALQHSTLTSIVEK
jgi:hypothetical protein